MTAKGNKNRKAAIALAAAAMLAHGVFAATLKIMPLGDSITYGQGWDPHGGYRAVLREKLVAAGYSVDYVGTQTGNRGTLSESGDIQHEGHPGYGVNQIATALPGWSAMVDGPNVILLLIGTNNCNTDHSTVMVWLGELLDEIKRIQPSAHVVCGTIPPFLNGSEVGSNNVWVEDHNTLVRAEVARRAGNGDRISLADIYPVVSPTEGMNDDRHPNEAGYRAMAQVWFDAIEAAFPDPAAAGGEVDLAAVSCVMDETTGDKFAVSFNDPVSDDATSLDHYDFGGTFVAAGATLSEDRHVVTIIGSKPVMPGVTCTVTVSGVRNLAGTKTADAASFDFRFLPYGAKYYVPEFGKYRKVYEFTFTNQKYGSQAPNYDFDDHLNIGAYTRIAYWIELQKEGEEMQYLWVSMDKFTDDPSKIAIPTKYALTGDKEIFQQYVYNMKVVSNVEGVTSGEKAVGNIEFWPYNYYKDVKLGITGASSSIYDVDDSCNLSGSFACMQIHDTAALTPLFCYNNWGGTGNGSYDLGLGSQTGSGNTDWTQSNSSDTWTKRRHMEIYVMEDIADTNVPQVVSTSFSESRNAMTVVFDRPVYDDSDLASKVSLTDGTAIKSASLADVRTLVVSFRALRKVEGVSLVLEGLRAATPAHTLIPRLALQIPGEDIPFEYSEAPASVVEKVPAAADYAHLFTIDIQPNMCLNIKDGTSYVNKVDSDVYDAVHTVNNTNSAPVLYSRVGYLLELVDNSDHTNWVWTAFDAFSSDYGDIDIPTANPDHPKGGYVNGRFVANLDVDSNVEGIVKGTGLATGVIEFTPWDYGGANNRSVPNADGNYDFGDQLYERVGNYACMQVSNYDAELPNGARGQILWNVGRFNGRGVCVGFGNSTDATHRDWTFINNAGNYKSRTLYVLVKPDDDADLSTDYVPSRAVASADGRKVCVTFDDAVRESAAQTRYYTVPGRTVVAAEHSALDARDVILTLSEQLSQGETYSVETCLPKSTNKTLTLLTSRSLPTALTEGVSEIGDYVLINDLDIANNVSYAKNGAPYRTDETRFGVVAQYDRVAYALELDDTAKGGNYRWAWVSMDPFTDDATKLGVPSVVRQNHFQCYVTNISVRAGSSSGVAPIATGEWTKGNIEFTPSNYAGENEANIPDATSAFDFGDRLYGSGTSAGHGCMQIHNYQEKDMILGVTRLGNGQDPGIYIGLVHKSDGSISDGTWEGNAASLATKNLRVFVRPVAVPAPEPVVADKGIGPEFLVQPKSVRVKLPSGSGPQPAALNSYAPGATRYQWRKNGVDVPGATEPFLDVVVSSFEPDVYQVIAFADEDNYTFSNPVTVVGLPTGLVITLR